MTTALTVHDGPGTAVDLRLPAPIDKVALRSYLALLEDPEAFELQNRLAAVYDKACKALIGPNDVQKEGKGDQAREFKKKSAWKKLARYFSISTTVLAREERFVLDESTGESVFVAICTVRSVGPWGQAADAVGACATDEETGRRKITIADAIATAETRASNRAVSNLVAMGEVSAEETTREDREQVVRDAAAEMTIAEAGAVVFPWKNPPKYRDKPLSELSLNMLQSVLDAAEKEIAKTGETPRRVELRQACKLLIAERQRVAAVEVERAEEARVDGAPAGSGEGEPAAVVDTKLAPGKVEDALDKPARGTDVGEARSQSQSQQSASATPPTSAPEPAATSGSMTELAQRITALLLHEKFDEADRALMRRRLEKATTIAQLEELVGDVQNVIDAPF